jgi:hypothetical protein
MLKTTPVALVLAARTMFLYPHEINLDVELVRIGRIRRLLSREEVRRTDCAEWGARIRVSGKQGADRDGFARRDAGTFRVGANDVLRSEMSN